MRKTVFLLVAICSFIPAMAQNYPNRYFRHPLDIPMQLVANFGEIRANHWHMGLDIRTAQRENLPVYAAAEGYVARVLVEPGGFGQAIYIAHPNGFTTLYAHMNGFYPALQQRVKQEQYSRESWRVNLEFRSDEFPLSKGDYIGLSGNTGGSAGPHVHFEIRDSKTEKVLNPLLFGFPIPDAVPPSVVRLAMYDRNKSTYAQSPQFLNIAAVRHKTVTVKSNRISFAVGATDRFSGSNNPNGIYSAAVLVDGEPVSSFVLNNIGYDETRYINAQIDYPYNARGGASLQHITPLPGATATAYNTYDGDGVVNLSDTAPHEVLIDVKDANGNTTKIAFTVQWNGAVEERSAHSDNHLPPVNELVPNQINIVDESTFQLVTSEKTIYDTVTTNVVIEAIGSGAAVSPLIRFLDASIPAHDSVVVRLKPMVSVSDENRDRIVIKSVSGSRTVVQKAVWQKGWLAARFRQFGTYQAFIDNTPPTVNAPPANLTKAARIVFTPTDNFSVIKNFRVELDGQWLRFTNDKGRSWIYSFDEKFPPGEHVLKVRIEDEAGNVTEREWVVRR